MKNLILIAFVFFAAEFASAQSKIAHVNLQEIRDTMPSYQEALNKLESFQKQGETELKTMQNNFEKSYQEAMEMEQRGVLTTKQRESKSSELGQIQEAIQAREESLVREWEEYSEKLNQSILEKVNKTMQIVSDRDNYDYVFDISTALIANGPDITKQVITEILKLE